MAQWSQKVNGALGFEIIQPPTASKSCIFLMVSTQVWASCWCHILIETLDVDTYIQHMLKSSFSSSTMSIWLYGNILYSSNPYDGIISNLNTPCLSNILMIIGNPFFMVCHVFRGNISSIPHIIIIIEFSEFSCEWLCFGKNFHIISIAQLYLCHLSHFSIKCTRFLTIFGIFPTSWRFLGTLFSRYSHFHWPKWPHSPHWLCVFHFAIFFAHFFGCNIQMLVASRFHPWYIHVFWKKDLINMINALPSRLLHSFLL